MTQDNNSNALRPGIVLSGALFNEPMRIVTANSSGDTRWTLGLVGVHSERYRSVTLDERTVDAGVMVTGQGSRLLTVTPAHRSVSWTGASDHRERQYWPSPPRPPPLVPPRKAQRSTGDEDELPGQRVEIPDVTLRISRN